MVNVLNLLLISSTFNNYYGPDQNKILYYEGVGGDVLFLFLHFWDLTSRVWFGVVEVVTTAVSGTWTT